MKLKLNNDADLQAFEQVAGLQNSRSVAQTLAEYIAFSLESNCENLTIIIAKSLLSDSYRGNPSLFGNKLLSKMGDDWLDSSGYQTPGKPTHVTIELLRVAKPPHQRRAQSNPSLKQIIKTWLNLNEPRHKRLRVPHTAIPPFYMSHSEQLTYTLNKETGTSIKIIKLQKSWLIARK